MQKKKQFTFWMLMFNLISLIMISCVQKQEIAISSTDLTELKSKYDIETINYFYETVFHEDFSRETGDIISKWNTNPKIVFSGTPTADQKSYVEKAIAEINDLNLPVQCSLGNAGDSLSINIFFGDYPNVCRFLKLDSLFISETDTGNHFGLARSISYDGAIEKAQIGIYYTNKDTSQSTRYKVVLEEIIQSLGIVGDSYNYPGSLFFERYNPAKKLTPLDIKVLSLLYEPAIPANCARTAFERDFADELYAVNTTEKIRKLLKGFSIAARSDIERCFTGDVLLKHPKETNVYVSGAKNKEDSITIEQAIFSVNKITPNLNIKLHPLPAPEPTQGIVIDIRQVSQQKERIKRKDESIAGSDCMFQKLIKNRVAISFNTSEIDKKLRQRVFIDALYFSLVPIPQEQSKTNTLFEETNGMIEFSPRYAALLKLMYSNELTDGLKLSEFRRIR